MKILVEENGKTIVSLALPTGLIFNNLSATVGSKYANKYIPSETGLELTPENMREIVKVIKQLKKKYGQLDIVEVFDHDGTHVKISL